MPFLDGGDELPRDRAAEDLVDELELAAARQRLHADLAVAELAVAAGLLLVAAVSVDARRDGLAIGDARRLQVHFDAEPPLQLRDGDLDVELPLAGQEQLVGLRIAGVADGAVLLLEPVHRRADLVLVAAALRLDGVGQHRFGEGDGREGDARRPCRRACRWCACPSAWRRRPRSPAFTLRHGHLGLALQHDEVAEPLLRTSRSRW